jgi:sugar lactone lactonase YvrE
MYLRRIVVNWGLLGASLTAADAQQYLISTYAGGAPASPLAAIALAADAQGNVYFADGYGYTHGPAPSNSVFKIDSSGSITRIAGDSRTGFSRDGGPATSASLYSPLAVAADRAGNVFIVDAGNQRVRRVATDGTITTVAGGGSAVLGDGGAAIAGQLNYPNSIAVDNAGDLFIGEYGRVRKVTPDGVITTVAGGGPNNPADGEAAPSAQLGAVMGVAVGAAGDLFLAEEYDDPEICDTVYRLWRVTSDGIINTLPRVANCCFYSQIAADAAGNLIVPAGPNIWRISPSGSQTAIAGNGSYGSPSGDGGPAIKAQLNGPTAVAVGPAGDLFIADNAGRSVRRVMSDGIIRTFASINTSLPGSVVPPSGDGGPAISAQLQLAVSGLSIQSGLAADSAGNLYIAETGAHRVRKVSPSGTITTVAGVGQARCANSPSNCLPLGDGGPATSAPLTFPTSVAVDGAGNVFIADSSNLRVRKVSADGMITTVAGNGNPPVWPGGAGDGGLAINAPVIPYSVAVDRAGDLFIGEGNFADIRKVSPDGTISTVPAPNTASVYFGYIEATTVDRAGNLYVAGSSCDNDDSCFNSIRRVSPSGDVSVVAGGQNGYPLQSGSGIGDGGPAIKAFIGFVSNLAVDSAGNLFVADLIGQRIRMIDVNGIITTVGGNGATGYWGDGGPATKATVNSPLGLATDAADNVYLSDFNQAVRILRPAQSK